MNLPTSNGKSGFDSRLNDGADESWWFDASLRSYPPIALQAGDALVSARSLATPHTVPEVMRSEDMNVSPVASVLGADRPRRRPQPRTPSGPPTAIAVRPSTRASALQPICCHRWPRRTIADAYARRSSRPVPAAMDRHQRLPLRRARRVHAELRPARRLRGELREPAPHARPFPRPTR